MRRQELQSRGFVALMSVIIISVVMTTMVFTLNLASFFNRFDALANDNKRVSLGLAEACIEAAKLKLAQNVAYVPAAGGDCVSVSDTCGVSGATKTCRICQVTSVGASRTIISRAVTVGSYTNIQVTGTLAPSSFSVTNWIQLELHRQLA